MQPRTMLLEIVRTRPDLIRLGTVGRAASEGFIAGPAGCDSVQALLMSVEIVLGAEPAVGFPASRDVTDEGSGVAQAVFPALQIQLELADGVCETRAYLSSERFLMSTSGQLGQFQGGPSTSGKAANCWK